MTDTVDLATLTRNVLTEQAGVYQRAGDTLPRQCMTLYRTSVRLSMSSSVLATNWRATPRNSVGGAT